jgi:hypothetical protein
VFVDRHIKSLLPFNTLQSLSALCSFIMVKHIITLALAIAYASAQATNVQFAPGLVPTISPQLLTVLSLGQAALVPDDILNQAIQASTPNGTLKSRPAGPQVSKRREDDKRGGNHHHPHNGWQWCNGGAVYDGDRLVAFVDPTTN